MCQKMSFFYFLLFRLNVHVLLFVLHYLIFYSLMKHEKYVSDVVQFICEFLLIINNFQYLGKKINNINDLLLYSIHIIRNSS